MKTRLMLAASAAAVLVFGPGAGAQTATSLFRLTDSLQVSEIASARAVQYYSTGHHGPAIENSACALRIYFNDSGAIDVYSKSGARMELLKYLWYPDSTQQKEEGAGRDEYLVGRTLGLGGIALWDGNEVVRLKATGGRKARTGKIRGGSFAEMTAYGVPYMDGLVDISIHIEMKDRSRVAKVTATEINGKKVQFVTGINYHDGEQVKYGRKYIAVWGVHPMNPGGQPISIGAGMRFRPGRFVMTERTGDEVLIISRPTDEISTEIIAASSLEEELGTAGEFFKYMRK